MNLNPINKIWFFIGSLSFVLVMLLSSCSPQRKLAKEIVDQTPEWGVLALMPEQIFMINNRYDSNDENMEGLSEYEKNQQLLEQTLLLSKVDDTLVRRLFETAYLSTLRSYGVLVYEESAFEDFYERDSLSWVVNIAQLELQEFIENYEDEENFFGMRYLQTIPLNAVNIGVWVEISRLNGSSQKAPVYFSDQNLFDALESDFVFDFSTNSVNYYYNIDSLTPQNVYDFSGFMGRLTAAYTYDQILNNQLEQQQGISDEDPVFYRYDPYLKRLFPTEYDRFILMEE